MKLQIYLNLFADDAKIMRRVRKMEDCNNLQEDLDKIYEWSVKWQMVVVVMKQK